MKLLLTGQPGSGKTTLLEKFVSDIPNKQGFITREIKDGDTRTGFELVSSLGHSAILASADSHSSIRVSRYGVDVGGLNNFMDTLPPIEPQNLLYIDEIGQMELFSDKFKKLVREYLAAENPYAGTITSVYSDAFTKEVLSRSDILLLTVDPENRTVLTEALEGLATNMRLLEGWDSAMQARVVDMAQGYVATQSYMQLKKLFKNGIKYVAEDKVKRISPNQYAIRGNHKVHQVLRSEESWTCDCDLFNGKGNHAGDPGECSHIQSVKINS